MHLAAEVPPSVVVGTSWLLEHREAWVTHHVVSSFILSLVMGTWFEEQAWGLIWEGVGEFRSAILPSLRNSITFDIFTHNLRSGVNWGAWWTWSEELVGNTDIVVIHTCVCGICIWFYFAQHSAMICASCCCGVMLGIGFHMGVCV